MELLDVLRVGLRFGHALAAVAWIGGSLFYVLALDPALSRVGRTPDRAALLSAVGQEFRQAIRLAIVVFLVTGVILTFDRLSQPRISTLYVGVLGVKIALALWMFWLARRLERLQVTEEKGRAEGAAHFSAGRSTERPVGPTALGRGVRPQPLVLTLGVAVYLLAIVLKVLFEAALLGE